MAESKQSSEEPSVQSQATSSYISHRKQLRARIEELEQQTASLSQEIEVERDKRLRLAAEYDNYRRRTQQEYRLLALAAGERILVKLLPIIDDFDRMMAHQDADAGSLRQGFEMIHRKLQSLFESEGVSPLPAIGTPFDSSLHEAVAQLPAPDASPGEILAEVERGYRLHEKIIRHAKVVVAQSLETSDAADGE